MLIISVLAPYYCAGVGGTASAAACASLPSLISTTIETAATYEENALGVIDDPNNMKNDRIWIFNGQNDTKMHPGMPTLYYTIIDFNEVDIRIYLPEKVIIHRGR